MKLEDITADTAMEVMDQRVPSESPDYDPAQKPRPFTPKYWAGPVPTKCDLCKGPIRRRFFDMATSSGKWGILCGTCAAFEIGNRQYGPGVGQEYQYDNLNAKWLKVRG